MKGNKFESRKEILQSLIDGKKVRLDEWEDGGYVQFDFKNTRLVTEMGHQYKTTFDAYESFEIYEEPQPRKLYAFENERGDIRFKKSDNVSQFSIKENGIGVYVLKRAPEYDINYEEQ